MERSETTPFIINDTILNAIRSIPKAQRDKLFATQKRPLAIQKTVLPCVTTKRS